MITFFAIPKPFKGHNAIIQRNAIRSWTQLRPECEILLFGDEEGTAEMANQYGLRHVPKVERNEYGTPLISDIFKQAQRLASYNLLCYVNADIILFNNFMNAVEAIIYNKHKFLMAGQRWDLDVDKDIDFSPGWENETRKILNQKGKLHPKYGMDYFVFRRWSFEKLPPFAVGRPTWDNWMIFLARSNGFNVINATPVVTAIHQNHDYLHVPQGTGCSYEGPEAKINRSIVGSKIRIYTLDDANFTLTQKYLLLIQSQITRPFVWKIQDCKRDFINLISRIKQGP